MPFVDCVVLRATGKLSSAIAATNSGASFLAKRTSFVLLIEGPHSALSQFGSQVRSHAHCGRSKRNGSDSNHQRGLVDYDLRAGRRSHQRPFWQAPARCIDFKSTANSSPQLVAVKPHVDCQGAQRLLRSAAMPVTRHTARVGSTPRQ